MPSGGAEPLLGLRERKKLERRAAIEARALELFETRGFDSTTVNEIAEAAGIAPRTFFYYFDTKEDVVLADYARRLDRIIEELSRRPLEEPPWRALKESFLAVAGDYEEEQHLLRRRFTVMAHNPSVFARSLQLQAGWEDGLARALIERAERATATDSRGVPKQVTAWGASVEPRLLAAAAVATMRSSLRQWLESTVGPGSPQQALPPLVAHCFDRLARGLEELPGPAPA